MKRNSGETAQKRSQPVMLCCELLQGLKPFVLKELKDSLGKNMTLIENDDPETIFIHYTGDLHNLLSLRTIVAVYLVQHFAITRPRALLGHEHYQRLLEHIYIVRALQTFSGLRISAAGQDSSVFTTLKTRLSEDTGLSYDAEEGDLLLRIRPSSLNVAGWELLTRLSPRPLSTRSWRVHNMKGALNATVAAAMVEMTQPQAHDRFLNVMCGSGTLLIERLFRESAALAVGCDVNMDALHGAQKNMEVGRVARNVLLFTSDATQLPFLARTFNVICGDLPWGQLVGSHQQNSELYPRIFAETARLATPDAKLVLLTHEIALFEAVLQKYAQTWALKEVVKVFQGGLHPRIYLFEHSVC